jgi:hypothetical protein
MKSIMEEEYFGVEGKSYFPFMICKFEASSKGPKKKQTLYKTQPKAQMSL